MTLAKAMTMSAVADVDLAEVLNPSCSARVVDSSLHLVKAAPVVDYAKMTERVMQPSAAASSCIEQHGQSQVSQND